MKPRPARIGLAALGLYAAVFVVASAVGSMTYFHFGNPRDTCASCHEMGDNHAAWSRSAHRTLHCRECHGGSLTLNVHALEAHVNRVVQHYAGDHTKPIRLAERDVLHAHDSCRKCHPQSVADWQSSRHATTYERIFLDPEHNRKELPADDCLRCHGMFYHRGIETLLAPLNQIGPWALKEPAQAARPAIPCLACHQVHTPAGRDAAAKAHFYDCRDERYFPVTSLPAPAMTHEGQPIRLTTDPRARLCTQCHAPSLAAFHRPGTGDDRTPRGVHEGLSCLDCHRPHTNAARASCQSCHPAQSHCGLDVEKMDTTFLNQASRHDIHTVACRDCHPQGVPSARRSTLLPP
jgi:hypothetical protein